MSRIERYWLDLIRVSMIVDEAESSQAPVAHAVIRIKDKL